MNLVFFGSFNQYSTLIAQSLLQHPTINLVAIVTTPPAPAGRKHVLHQTHTHSWAESIGLPVYTPNDLSVSPATLFKSKHPSIDYFVTAGYGKLIPNKWLTYPKFGSLNLHFSLLPKFRGANPAEWALLLNESETGITLMEMAPEFDTGNIIAQSVLSLIPTSSKDFAYNRETLYEKLYSLGAACLPTMLETYHQQRIKSSSITLGIPQPSNSPTPTAYRFNRAQSFIPWQCLLSAFENKPWKHELLPSYLQLATQYLQNTNDSFETGPFVERAIRALAGYPGVWSYAPTSKGKQRLKLHTALLKNQKLRLNSVQLEGKTPISFDQLIHSHTISLT